MNLSQPHPGLRSTNEERPVRVLLIEDDAVDRSLTTTRLIKRGYDVVAEMSLESALERISARPAPGERDDFDAVLLDLGLPGTAGLDAVRVLRGVLPDVAVVIRSGDGSPARAEESFDLGVQEYINKVEATPEQLDRAIRHAVRRAEFVEEQNFRALHDSMTGLANRTLLNDRLEIAVALGARSRSRTAVICLDLDGFKPINDTHGHAAGDRVLVEVAARLRAAVRPSDTVARVGGDEFVVVLGGLPSDSVAGRVADRILHSVQQPIADPTVGAVSVSTSIGIAAAGPDGVVAADQLIAADRACLRAKAAGGRRVVWARSLDLEAILRGTDRELRLEVRYQPIVDRNGEVVMREVLARLVDNDGVVTMPEMFLAEARSVGLMSVLDITVARKALRDARAGLVGQVSLNLSAETLLSDDALDELVEVLREFPEPPMVEVSEDAMGLEERWPAVLPRFRDAGLIVALDDFGSGAADLAKLVDIHADVVKLDKYFVQRLADRDRASAVFRSVVALCHEFGQVVVAEGIERMDQHDLVLDFGVDQWQGFLRAPGLPADQLADANA